ncbi:DM13 domain-containing protein [Paracidovorax citrulli]|uniref:DM13 domain-containing protein n=1 Tax=uncultured Stenotrophomonas sp. TaxID=165438 RepID=UPI0028D14F87|nr:DM13 domain-containing protein [uncultured Stenotrophomonas sp.]
MKRRLTLLLATHALTLAAGFGAGVYLLPILTAPDGPNAAVVAQAMANSEHSARFERGLKGSDPVHWADGKVGVSAMQIVFDGRMAPGPDYKVYLAREFVDNRGDFLRIKQDAQLIGDVKTFDRFLLDVPADVDVEAYTTVVVWCEAFSQFISAAQYRMYADPDR